MTKETLIKFAELFKKNGQEAKLEKVKATLKNQYGVVLEEAPKETEEKKTKKK